MARVDEIPSQSCLCKIKVHSRMFSCTMESLLLTPWSLPWQPWRPFDPYLLRIDRPFFVGFISGHRGPTRLIRELHISTCACINLRLEFKSVLGWVTSSWLFVAPMLVVPPSRAAVVWRPLQQLLASVLRGVSYLSDPRYAAGWTVIQVTHFVDFTKHYTPTTPVNF